MAADPPSGQDPMATQTPQPSDPISTGPRRTLTERVRDRVAAAGARLDGPANSAAPRAKRPRPNTLAAAALVVGANLPDIDALVYFVGRGGASALAFRRGWTHGVLAMAVLPAALTAGLQGWNRLVRGPETNHSPEPVLRPAQLLLLAALGVWSHPLLDLLNTYGVRLLMPFSGRWFYGDALFIVDPWVWLALAAGI